MNAGVGRIVIEGGERNKYWGHLRQGFPLGHKISRTKEGVKARAEISKTKTLTKPQGSQKGAPQVGCRVQN